MLTTLYRSVALSIQVSLSGFTQSANGRMRSSEEVEAEGLSFTVAAALVMTAGCVLDLCTAACITQHVHLQTATSEPNFEQCNYSCNSKSETKERPPAIWDDRKVTTGPVLRQLLCFSSRLTISRH